MKATEQPLTNLSNLAVVRGGLVSEPIRRELAGGSVVVHFDVATNVPSDAGGQSTAWVPVAWTDPSDAAVAALIVGEDVVVVGTIRRRFFRSGGMTQSRTELVAERAVPGRRTKTVRSLLSAVASTLAA